MNLSGASSILQTESPGEGIIFPLFSQFDPE
jgi:hypothetical protein